MMVGRVRCRKSSGSSWPYASPGSAKPSIFFSAALFSLRVPGLSAQDSSFRQAIAEYPDHDSGIIIIAVFVNFFFIKLGRYNKQTYGIVETF